MSQRLGTYIKLLLGLLVLTYCVKEALGNGDFKTFLEAARMLRSGEMPYGTWIFTSEGNHTLYFYSPLWMILLIPFSYLPYFVPKLLWLLLNVLFLYRIWHLLKSHLVSIALTATQWRWVMALTLLLSIRFVLHNFEMIQMTLFILWGMLESLSLFRNGKGLAGAALLAFVINVKLLPLVMLPYLLYRAHYRGLLLTLGFSIAYLLLPALFVGWSHNVLLHTEWWHAINPANAKHLAEFELGPHGLTALIPTLLSETTGKLPIARNIANLDEPAVLLILNATRLLLILGTLAFLRWPPFRPSTRLNAMWEVAYLTAVIPLIFPHQQKYAFALTLPAAFYLACFLVYNYAFKKQVMRQGKWLALIGLVGLSFVLMTVSSDAAIGRDLNKITQHFKTITWGTLALIGALGLAHPGMVLKTKKLAELPAEH